MTFYICTHHLGFGIWAALGILLLSTIIYNYLLLNDGSYVPPMPSIENKTQSNEDFAKQLDAHNRPYYLTLEINLEIFFLILLNAIGLFMANLRYKWIGVKDCSR